MTTVMVPDALSRKLLFLCHKLADVTGQSAAAGEAKMMMLDRVSAAVARISQIRVIARGQFLVLYPSGETLQGNSGSLTKLLCRRFAVLLHISVASVVFIIVCIRAIHAHIAQIALKHLSATRTIGHCQHSHRRHFPTLLVPYTQSIT